MAKTVQEMVKEFHRVFRHPAGEHLTQLSVSLRKLRLNLILEEVQELIEASGFEATADFTARHVEGTMQDSIEMADALGDIAYVVYGMAVVMGIDLDRVIEEIHLSNMSKLGEDGKPILREDGKILKGPSYERPNIAKALGLQYYDCFDESCPDRMMAHVHMPGTAGYGPMGGES